MDELLTALYAKSWETHINNAMDELTMLRKLPLHALGGNHMIPFDTWHAAQTQLLRLTNEVIVRTVQFVHGKDLALNSSTSAWKTLLGVSDSRGSFYSRKMRLIVEAARRENHVAWELVLLHILSLIDDSAVDREWSHQPERDALYCGIYLEAVEELIEIGHAQNPFENFNTFISRSLIEVWYLNLEGASEETHEQYFKLILKLQPHSKFKAAFSPGGLRIIYSRAFQLMRKAADHPKYKIYSNNLVEQLFMCHQATNTISSLSDYLTDLSPLFMECLSSDEDSRSKTLLSTIFARSLWIAEGYGHLESFIASLACWMANLEISEQHTGYYRINAIRAFSHFFLGEWELASQCALSVREWWPTMLADIETRRYLPYRELKLVLVSFFGVQGESLVDSPRLTPAISCRAKSFRGAKYRESPLFNHNCISSCPCESMYLNCNTRPKLMGELGDAWRPYAGFADTSFQFDYSLRSAETDTTIPSSKLAGH